MMTRRQSIAALQEDFNQTRARVGLQYDIQIFDSMRHNPIRAYLSYEDIVAVNMLFTDPEFSTKSKTEKFGILDAILKPRGFVQFHSGTNRVSYRCLYDDSFLLKIGVDSIGVSDNLAENINQHVLKPFVPKVFDVTSCGTIQMAERVQPVRNRQEFYNIGGAVFDILIMNILGKYIIEDFGTDFFMNWGVRVGFGPVLLDFPYVYIADPSKLRCVEILPNGTFCGGDLEYDDGLNTIVCSRCGKRYAAKELGRRVTWADVQNRNSKPVTFHNIFDNVLIKGNDGKWKGIEVPNVPVEVSEKILDKKEEPKIELPKQEVQHHSRSKTHYKTKYADLM